jgi:hypothetical protein
MAGFVHDDVMASKRGKLLINLGNALEASLGRGNDRGDWPERVRAEAEGVLRAAGLGWDDVGMDIPRRKELMQMGEVPGEERFRRLDLAKPHAWDGPGGDGLPQRRDRVAGADAREPRRPERVHDRRDGPWATRSASPR